MRLSLGMKAKIVAITLCCCVPLLVLSVRGSIVAAAAAILLCNPGGGQAESLSLRLHICLLVERLVCKCEEMQLCL